MEQTAPIDTRTVPSPRRAPGAPPEGLPSGDRQPVAPSRRRRWTRVLAILLVGLLVGTGIQASRGAADLAQAQEDARSAGEARRGAETQALEATQAREEAEAARAAAEDAQRAAGEARAAAEAQLAEAQREVEDLTGQLSAAQAALASAKSSAKTQSSAISSPEASDEPSAEAALGGAGTSYANCSAVRAAGADPIRVGDPGYSRALDRDGDGVGCE